MSIKSTRSNWFQEWFNSNYYHLLYNNRNDEEAKAFIELLIGKLDLPLGTRILDLACGKGRHSITLANLGFSVLGVDLAEDSIEEANTSKKENLSFSVKDMRDLTGIGSFGAVLNLFTSFGYFENDSDQKKVLSEVHSILDKNGTFVIDFLNEKLVRSSIVPEISIQREMEGRSVIFEIEKKLEDKRVLKNIRFSDQGEEYHFQERVRLIPQHELVAWIEDAGFDIIYTFGDYNLSAFNLESSPRLILVARKSN